MRIESKQSAPDEAEGFRPARFCAEGAPQERRMEAGLAEASCGGWGEWEQVWGLAALGGSDFAA